MSQPSFSSSGGGYIDVNDASIRFTSVGAGVTFQDGSEMFSRDDADQNLQNVLDNGAAASVTMDLTNTGTGLTTAGDVAVGSSDPEDTRLHVTGNAFITQDLYIDNSLAANVVLNVAGGINAANFFGDGGLLTNVTAPQSLQDVVDVGNVSTEVVSLVNNTLALSTGGNLGVNVAAPGATLHVVGNANITASANIGTYANIGSHANIAGDVNTQSEVIATHFHGDGSNITNLANATQNQILFAGQDGLANGVVGLGMTFGTTPGTDANTLTMSGDFVTTNLRVTNNLQVTGTVTQIHTDNLTVTDPIVSLNEDNAQDATTGFVFNRGYGPPGAPSNVMIAVCSSEESGALDEHLVLARTTNASDSATLAPTNSLANGGELEVNVFGNFTTSGNIHGEWLHGDGSNLTGLVSDLQSVVDNGNTLTTNKIHLVDGANLISESHAMFGSNTDTAHANVHVVGNVFVSNALETNAIHMTHADLTGVVIKTASTISPSVAIGRDNAPGTQSVAIGDRAGADGAAAVAVGALAGQTTQGGGAVAVGLSAGNATQGVGAVAVGSSAGRTTQGASTVAVGAEAGRVEQNTQSVAVGYAAGKSNQNSRSVAIGNQAGENGQNVASVAIGYLAGQIRQNASAIAIGFEAGKEEQNTYAVAVGRQAGESTQNAYAISVGYLAGQEFQNAGAISVGYQAGRSGQGSASIALGQSAAANYQDSYSVAIGGDAGRDAQNTSAVAIGFDAAKTHQRSYSVAIGRGAANHKQNTAAVAIGYLAGESYQALEAIHVGFEAGQTNSNLANDGTARGQVGIGYRAGKTSQGKAAVAIGKLAGETDQHAHSVVINASGAALDTGSENAFYVSSVRLDETNVSPMVSWNLASNEVVTIAGVNAHASNASLELSGNLYASNLYGNGSGLTGLATTLQSVTEFGATTDQTVTFENTTTALVTDTGTFTALGGGDGSGTTLHVTGNAHVSNAVTTTNVALTDGFLEMRSTTADAAIYKLDFGSANTLYLNVVQDAGANVGAIDVSNTGNIHMSQNLAVGTALTTNVIYFGEGGSVSSSGGLDLNNVVSRGAVTETGIIIETDHSTTSLTAQVIASNILTSNLVSAVGYRLPLNPADNGVHMGLYSSLDQSAGIEMVSEAAGWGVIDFRKSDDTLNWEQRITGGNGDRLDFYTGTESGGGIRMSIDSDGDVGIGTTTPTEKLEVGGNIKASGYVEAPSMRLEGVGEAWNTWLDFAAPANSGGGDFDARIIYNSLSTSTIADQDLRIVLSTDGAGTNPTNPNMKFTRDGKVGINTASPTEALDVSGTIKATTLNLSGLPTSSVGLSSGDVYNDGGVLKIV